MKNEYYVYGLFDSSTKYEKDISTSKGQVSLDYLPIYIGKGKGYRMYVHTYNNTKDLVNYPKRKKLKELTQNNTLLKIKIKEGLEEKDALLFESELIEIIGRNSKKNGPLYNLQSGNESYLDIIKIANKKKKMSKYKISCYDLNKNLIFDNYETFQIKEEFKITIDTIYSLIKGKYYSFKYRVFMFPENLSFKEIEDIIDSYSYKNKKIRKWGSLYNIFDLDNNIIYKEKSNKDLFKIFGKHDYSQYSRLSMIFLGKYKVEKLPFPIVVNHNLIKINS